MPLLSDKVRESVRKELAALPGPVKMVVFTQELECESCPENVQLARELGELSDKVQVEVHQFLQDKEAVSKYGVDKVPATIIEGSQGHHRVRFYGHG